MIKGMTNHIREPANNNRLSIGWLKKFIPELGNMKNAQLAISIKSQIIHKM